MIAKFDTYNNYDDLVVSLRQPSDEFIDFVEVRNINISPEFNAVSEMSCTIYKTDNLTETYDAIEVKRQLYVEDRGYFIITACEDYKDDEGEYKSLTLLSCEHELSYKKLNYFKGTYKFYGTFTDENGNEKRGLMDEIMQSLPRWSIAHIDDTVAERWRTFDEPDTTLYAFLMEDCEESYECIFEFDIKTKEIYVYDKNNYIKKTTICLSREDVISSIKTNTKVENIYTAISIYGEDDITINSLNPLGTATLYNFSYYKPWMSESLRNKLTIWENKIKTYEPEMETNRNSLATLMTELQSIQTNINTANEDITLYEKHMGVDSINEEFIASLNALIIEQRSLLEQYNTNKNNKEAEINTLQERFNTIYTDCNFETNFTVDEIKELDAYIYESSYVEDNLNITENMTYAEEYGIIKQLYDKGKEVSENLGYPAEELTIDTNNFIFQKEFADYTEQLETGCLIDIALDDDNIVTYVLLKIDVNYEDKTIALTLGNKYRTSDAQALFKDWQANVSNAASTLTYERSKYGKAVDSGSLDRINSFMQSSLDLTLNAVKASDGQSMEMTDSGLKGRRINPDTNKVDPEQIWITSNNIVFTDDNWQSIKTAIGRLILPDGTIGYGINAEYLLGKWIIGENMEITNENGSFKITKDGIKSEFYDEKLDNLQVGGRNLILNSKDMIGITHYIVTMLTYRTEGLTYKGKKLYYKEV